MIFYVHVGKTGGTAIKRQVRAHFGVQKSKEPQIIKNGIVLLNHVSLEGAVQKFGAPSGIAFAFRDPTARFISGFYCRQRMGWPDHKALWDAREAAAFAHFDTANDLAEALNTSDLKQRAAAHFAMNAIRHLRKGYAFHFGDMTSFFLDYGSLIKACVDTTNIDNEGADFLKKIGLSIPKGTEFSKPKQKVEYPRGLSETATQNLREFWAVEYEYYEAFKLLRGHF